MPATAGRVRMPANNRVHSSAALQTHSIWKSAIGYDPYAPKDNNQHGPSSSSVGTNAAALPSSDPAASSQSAYASFQAVLALARAAGSDSDVTRGACKKCGRVGHLTFQCRNFLSGKELRMDDDIQASMQAIPQDKTRYEEATKKTSGGKENSDREDEDEIDSDSSDSDIDPEMEKIIAQREHADGHEGIRSREEDKKANRPRSSNDGRSKQRKSDIEDDWEVEITKDKKNSTRKKHKSSDMGSASRKRHTQSRKDRRRQRIHRTEDDSSYEDESRGERRKLCRHHKRGHHRRDASDGSDSVSYAYESLSDRKRSSKQKSRRRSEIHGLVEDGRVVP